MKNILSIVPLFCLYLLSFSGSAALINPQETLDLTFDTPIPPLGDRIYKFDTMYLALNGYGSATSATASLYDGSVLLGANTVSLNNTPAAEFYFHWATPSSHAITTDLNYLNATQLTSENLGSKISINFDGDFYLNKPYFGIGEGLIGGAIVISGYASSIQSVSINPKIVATPLPGGVVLFLNGAMVLLRISKVA